jgi:hypothetical protein
MSMRGGAPMAADFPMIGRPTGSGPPPTPSAVRSRQAAT